MTRSVRLPIVVALALALVLGLTAVAVAANPHFIRADANLQNDGDLKVSFKVVGLGNAIDDDVVIEASADVEAEWWCINRGGKHPQASNKEDVTGEVTESDTFDVKRNGQVTGSLTLSVPEGDLNCPPGQQKVLASVYWDEVTLTVYDNGNILDETTIEGPWSATYYE